MREKVLPYKSENHMVFYTVNGIEQEYLLSKDKVRVLALKRQSGMVELSNYTD